MTEIQLSQLALHQQLTPSLYGNVSATRSNLVRPANKRHKIKANKNQAMEIFFLKIKSSSLTLTLVA